MTERQLAILGMVGGGLAVVGALLPWATVATAFGSVSATGIDGDGKFALGLGAVIALAAFIRYGSGGKRGIIALLGIVTLVLAAFEYQSVSARIDPTAAFHESVGAGLYLVFLGGAAALLSSGRSKPAR